MSFALRHAPEQAGVMLDGAGWTTVSSLLDALARAGHTVDRAALEAIVRTDAKGRYAFSPDGARIRANQGHSHPVDLGLVAEAPPPTLFHGTVAVNVEAIRRAGLLPMGRQHVHLSADRETAAAVGRRRGEPVILVIQAGAMHAAGHRFFRSENGVWLTDAVAAEWIE